MSGSVNTILLKMLSTLFLLLICYFFITLLCWHKLYCWIVKRMSSKCTRTILYLSLIFILYLHGIRPIQYMESDQIHFIMLLWWMQAEVLNQGKSKSIPLSTTLAYQFNPYESASWKELTKFWPSSEQLAMLMFLLGYYTKWMLKHL